MLYDKGLLVIDLYFMSIVILKGIAIAIPIWICYIGLKIKFIDWKETW